MLSSKNTLTYLFFSASMLLVQAQSSILPVQACKDKALTVNQVPLDKGVKFEFVQAKNLLECTINFDPPKLENLSTNLPNPYSFVLENSGSTTPITFKPTVKGKSWRYTGAWHYSWQIGAPSKLKTDDHIYELPYQTGQSFPITQTYFGDFSHNKGSESEYAVDFTMPEGTSVLAARQGLVIATRADSTSGGPDKKFLHCTNYVVIKHSDGTYARYAHLKTDGVQVKPGQKIQSGDLLGYSGCTGFSSKPHLHFIVFRVIDGQKTYSLPFKLRTNQGIIDKPKLNVAYSH